MDNNARRIRRRKRKAVRIIVFAAILITACAVEWFVLTQTALFDATQKKLSGSWTQTVDITDEAATGIAMWISSVQNCEVTVQDVYNSLGKQYITVTWSFDSETGEYSTQIHPEDYDACKAGVYECCGNLLEQLTAQRIEYSGIDIEMTGMDLEALIQDALGMDTNEFLMKQVPNLIPDMDSISSEYCSSGTYSVYRDRITLINGQSQELECVISFTDMGACLSAVDGSDSIWLSREVE